MGSQSLNLWSKYPIIPMILKKKHTIGFFAMIMCANLIVSSVWILGTFRIRLLRSFICLIRMYSDCFIRLRLINELLHLAWCIAGRMKWRQKFTLKLQIRFIMRKYMAIMGSACRRLVRMIRRLRYIKKCCNWAVQNGSIDKWNIAIPQ